MLYLLTYDTYLKASEI